LHKQWCIPAVTAEFICFMEDILDLYEMGYDFRYPIVCLDEKPYQLLRDILSPLPPEPGKAWREDYTYERNGTCNLFVIFCPGLGWRHIEVTGQRTALDYAEILRKLVDEYFPEAERILVVQDNLNTLEHLCIRHLMQKKRLGYIESLSSIIHQFMPVG